VAGNNNKANKVLCLGERSQIVAGSFHKIFQSSSIIKYPKDNGQSPELLTI